MNKKSFALILVLALVLVAPSAFAQAKRKTPATGARATTSTRSSSASPLSLLPPSDFVAFVNVRRIIDEAAPKVFADNPQKLAEFQDDLNKLKAETGIDARSFSTLAVGMRYLNPSPNVTTADTVVIANGTFDSAALIAAARVASKGKYQEQKYKTATVYVFNLNEQLKVTGLFNLSVKELAVAALGPNTLVLGELPAVRATIDAEKTRTAAGRANSDLLSLATREPDALVGFSANVPPSLVKGADFGNDEITRLLGSIRQAYGAIGTTASGFDLLAVARTERAEQAKDLSDTLASLKQFGAMLVGQLPAETSKLAQNALDSLKIASEGNETSVRLELQQADISTLMRVLKPKKAVTGDK